jgi:hypothetical protein
MRKSLGTLALILIIVAVIGISRDWFDLERRAEGETTEVQLRIDRERIRSDTRKAAEAAREFGDNLNRKLDEPKAKDADRPAEETAQEPSTENWQ